MVAYNFPRIENIKKYNNKTNFISTTIELCHVYES